MYTLPTLFTTKTAQALRDRQRRTKEADPNEASTTQVQVEKDADPKEKIEAKSSSMGDGKTTATTLLTQSTEEPQSATRPVYSWIYWWLRCKKTYNYSR